MMKAKKAFSLTLIILMLFALMLNFPAQKAFAAAYERLAGADRYKTAIKISQSGWEDGTGENVILATGLDFPDALSAAPLSRFLNAPILLADKNGISSALEGELVRLKAKNIYIVGGKGVISESIKAYLESKNYNVVRLEGEDRYQTSLSIAKYMASNFNMGNEIAVATGESFPDALSVAPVAAAKGMPILLTPKTSMTQGILKFIADNNITKAYGIGGSGVISDNVLKQLPANERIWGDDRFKTNIAVLKKFKDTLNFEKTFIATGNDFPDALAGSALAPKTSSPIILVNNTMPIPSADFILSMGDSIKQMAVLGGDGVVSEKILTNNSYGNTGGNINNFGFAAVQGDWLYYNNTTLYKSKIDGSQKTGINGDMPAFINVVGDYIYYINANENNNIYKVRTDGTARNKLGSDIAMYMVVVDGWIYYTNISDSGRLYKMKTDGTEKTRLTNEIAYNINVAGDFIYYTSLDDSGIVELYKIRKDGTGLTWLFGSSGIEFLNVSGDYAYIEATDASGEYGDLVKIATDGSGSTTISYNSTEFINVYGDYIYYSNADDGGRLYRIKTDGTGNTKISDDYAVFINIIGHWLLYDAVGQDETYRIRLDGTEKQPLN